MKSRRPRWLALALLLAAFALRCWRLGGPSLWYDEAYTWWVATQVSPQHSIASSLREIIPPFTYFLWRGWAAVAGTSEFALRAPSALLSIVGIAAAARIVWRLTRQRRGAIAALGLFAIAPPLLWAAREVRMYGPLLTLTLCAAMALLEVLFGPPERRRRWAWLWGATMCAALYTLVLAGFWLLGQGLFFLWILIRRPSATFSREDRRAVIRALVAPTALALLLYLPWLIGAAQHLGENRGYWAGHLPPEAFVRTTLRGITVGKFLPADVGAVLGGGIVILAALALAMTRHRPLAGLYPLLTTLPPLTILCYIYRDLPKWAPRHAALFAPAPLLAIAVAWGATATLPSRRRRRLTTGLLSVITLAAGAVLLRADANLLLNSAYARDDWRGVAAYVQAHRQPDDIVIIETGAVAPTWYYYAGPEQTLPLPPDDLLDVENVLHYTETAPLLTEALREAAGVWLVTWIADVTDPTSLVLTLLRQIGEEQPTPEFHEVGLHYIALDEPPAYPAWPPTTAQPEIELLPGLTLWGYHLPEAPQPADAPLEITTWWRTSRPEAHEGRVYGVSLRLYDAGPDPADGEEWRRIEGTPGSGDYRPERWPADALILGYYKMPLPAGIPPGAYRLELILYDGGQRAATSLGEVQIARPQQPPAIPAHLTPVAPLAFASDQPLRLLAAGVNRLDVKPCETLSGQLFWEVAAPLTQTFAARVALGENVVAAPIAPLVPPEMWQAGDRGLSHFHLPIHCRAQGMRASLEIALGAPLAAQQYGPIVEIDRARASLPPEMTSLDEVASGPALARLRGYTLEPAQVQANRPFTLTLYWQPMTITETAYTVFVHVTPADASAPVIAQDDAWPGQGAYPTYGWRPDEIIADPHPLPALPPGAYALRVGLYGLDGVRLPIAGEGATDRALEIPLAIVAP